VASDLNKLVADFVEFVKFLPKFRSNDVKASLAENLPPVLLDVDQIQQVLLNLVNNSVEAYSSAEIELRTEYDAASNVVRLVVRDNGPGIEESIMSRLFNEKVTTKVEGHGYGLPICKQILEAHGGSITIESSKGNGAAFIMTFPLSQGNMTT
jgi:signal transduction histidine kinase